MGGRKILAPCKLLLAKTILVQGINWTKIAAGHLVGNFTSCKEPPAATKKLLLIPAKRAKLHVMLLSPIIFNNFSTQ